MPRTSNEDTLRQDTYNRRTTDAFTACPKYLQHDLSEDQVLHIAKKAVELAMNELPEKIATKLEDKFFIQIGKVVTEKVLWLIGIVVIALWVWLVPIGGGMKNG